MDQMFQDFSRAVEGLARTPQGKGKLMDGVMDRRKFIHGAGAVTVVGVAASPAAATGLAGSQQLPEGVLIWGLGGAGCKVVRRLIDGGVDAGAFASIDGDRDDLTASRAANQIQCGCRGKQGSWVITCEDRQRAEGRIDALLVEASKVILVAGFGGRMGGNWAFEIAADGGLAGRHVLERGLRIEVVASMPRSCEGRNRGYAAAEILRRIKKAAGAAHVVDIDSLCVAQSASPDRAVLELAERRLAEAALRAAWA